MENPLLLLCFSVVLSSSLASSVRLALREGSSLSVDKPGDTLVSEDGTFAAGFRPVGENAYGFAIWFSKPSCSIQNCTVVWMANRDWPVNGRSSKLSLRKNGDLVLIDADRTVIWATSTGSSSRSSMKLLQLLNTGNLVLCDKQNVVSWQSFDSPTDTLLPQQKLTRNTPLVSSRSKNNFSSGYYRLYFDNDNLLRLLFDGPKITSVYWPDPWLNSWEAGRTSYNDSRVAMLDPYGNFTSSDDLKFLTSDYGLLLLNGHYSPSVAGGIHFRLPKFNLSSYKIPRIEYAALQCPANEILLPRTYVRRKESLAIKILLIFVGAIAGMEAIVVLMVWCFLYGTRPEKGGAYTDGCHTGPTGFRRFTYDELKKATRNFSKEIGRGSGGIVYKAMLLDCRVAAVKPLNEANQGENEFLAEVSTIGNLNHMNLIDMWAYCAEGKHRILVYEFMEHGSLVENLSAPTELDWSKRFEIAVGSARGLAYLHEECLEWVLHCDVKGWALPNPLPPLTSKVDVYSFGIVLLELVTGRSPTGGLANAEGGDENESRRLTSWVRERKRAGAPMEAWMKEIVDPRLTGECDVRKVEVLVVVALQCVEEDRDARPTMSEVVEMLLRYGDEDEDELILE
ncbi:putative receptor protein kinase ZmPK1 [Rhodamnia argentea]|uniref:Receptor protein kinase ZmPK1 n=1 Tax=Rhodamnia argentea TaxID=178133 RepID=A0ABM3GYJ5_9MYRT|nr:putative receptor protein kinase ZmPK1 [Rhodamnia argentea]